MKKIITMSVLVFWVLGTLSAQMTDTAKTKENSLGTSLLTILSFIPNSNAFYYELDYYHSIFGRNNLVCAFDVYKYTTPLSIPWTGDSTHYPGAVVSYGAVVAYQAFLFKNLYVLSAINPSILSYIDDAGTQNDIGFMLLFCLRIGYRFDFDICKVPFYFELGGEINYWPINTNEPQNFIEIEDKYPDYVFSPALNIGVRF